MDPNIKRILPKARLIEVNWSWRRFYFARFRLANAVRLQIGWLIVHHRTPWLEHSARAAHPHLFQRH
jgi:hypothetical protein